MPKPKIIVIVGPTASGKSELAVTLARRFNGEVISADSRQVYKGLDIATGKITKKEMRGIPHHLLDVASPKRTFTVAQFKKKAEKALHAILKKGKIPIIAGGTGFYISALVDNITLPNVPPNQKLRVRLEALDAEALHKKLSAYDPGRAATIDPRNRRRLIRAIEIARALGNVPAIKKENGHNALFIGLAPKNLRERIKERVRARIKRGMVAEAKRMRAQGITLRRMQELGLEYRFLAKYLEGKLSKEELSEKIETGDWQYAKRQMTWFKRDKRIHWFRPGDARAIFRFVGECLIRQRR